MQKTIDLDQLVADSLTAKMRFDLIREKIKIASENHAKDNWALEQQVKEKGYIMYPKIRSDVAALCGYSVKHKTFNQMFNYIVNELL